MRSWLIAILVVAVLSFALWTTDKITLEGERTVYTADCRDGSWQGKHCSGRLTAAERYRFRALKPHREVFFWTAGSSEPSGKFTDCDIKDGRNWICRPTADAARTITLQMATGEPVPDATGKTRAFHAVSKLRWFVLRLGIPMGSDADT